MTLRNASHEQKKVKQKGDTFRVLILGQFINSGHLDRNRHDRGRARGCGGPSGCWRLRWLPPWLWPISASKAPE